MMVNSRTLANSLAFSLLLHAAAVILASVVPVRVQAPGEVLVMELTDIPRAADFLPPRAGIIREGRPKQPPAPKNLSPERRTKDRAIPPRILEGRVPDFPVDPSLPPEKELPPARTKAEPPPAPKESAAAPSSAPEDLRKTARIGPVPDFGKPAGSEPQGRERSGPAPSGKDLTPSLGKTVIALASRGGRATGSEDATGSSAATEGKARNKGEIAEEPGGGTRLTALNAPEIQYISYFASIKRKIELVWQYPYDAQVQGIQGELTIDFAIGRNGTLDSVQLVRGSGSRLLDDEALSAIRKAAPFDPIPARYKIPDLRIRAHFIYEMHALRIQ